MPFRIIMNDDKIRPIVMTTTGMRFNSLHKIAFNNEFTEIFFENDDCNINSISFFLDELKDWVPADKFRLREHDDATKYLAFAFKKRDETSFLHIHVTPQGKGSLWISTRSLYTSWQRFVHIEDFNVDIRGRSLKRPRSEPVVYFKKTITPETEGSYVINFKRTPIFYDTSCYSEVFLYFCKKNSQKT